MDRINIISKLNEALPEGGKKHGNNIIKKEKRRSLLISLLIFIALTNKVINKVTGTLVTISIGRTVIVIKDST